MRANRHVVQHFHDKWPYDAQVSTDAAPRSEFSASAASSADAVLRAAFDVLVTEGLEHVTPTRLHSMTNVARTTIYRHWPTAEAILASILERATRDTAPLRTTGDVRTDLVNALNEVIHRISHGPVRQLVAALMTADCKRDAGEALLPNYLSALTGPVDQVLKEAVLNGHLRGPVAGLMNDLVGPLLFQAVLLGKPPTDAIPQQLVNRFLTRHS